jgi:signal peptidase I
MTNDGSQSNNPWAAPQAADRWDTALPTRSPDGKSSRKRTAEKTALAVALEWILIIGIAIGVAVVVRVFLFQPFYIPSASMVPTLEIGDKVLVNKLSYKFHAIHRGDIVVFSAPPGEATPEVKDLVKRVIGLSGDTVQGKADDGIYINGRRLEEPYLPEGITTKDFGPVQVPNGKLFVMGDNRMESKDSTVFGPVEANSVVGRVFLRYWPLSRFGTL